MIYRCETCPFWKMEPPFMGHPGPEWGTCRLADGNYRLEPLNDTTKAFCVGGEGGSLTTSRSFGCVMHPMNKAIC